MGVMFFSFFVLLYNKTRECNNILVGVREDGKRTERRVEALLIYLLVICSLNIIKHDYKIVDLALYNYNYLKYSLLEIF